MPEDVKIGNDIIRNVSEVKLEKADAPGEYASFTNAGGEGHDYSKAYMLAGNGAFFFGGEWCRAASTCAFIALRDVTSSSYEYASTDWNKSFEIEVVCRYLGDYSKSMVLFGCGTTSVYYRVPSIEFQPNGSSIWAGISSDGAAWTYDFVITNEEIPIEVNREYLLNLSYDASAHIGTLTVDSQGYHVVKQVPIQKIYSGTYTPFEFGCVANSGNHIAKNVNINYRKSFVKSDGELVWGFQKL